MGTQPLTSKACSQAVEVQNARLEVAIIRQKYYGRQIHLVLNTIATVEALLQTIERAEIDGSSLIQQDWMSVETRMRALRQMLLGADPG